MKVNNPPKLLLLMLSLVCLTVLLLFERMDPTYGYAMLGTIIGYGVGNGVAAKEGVDAQPIFGTTNRQRRIYDHKDE